MRLITLQVFTMKNILILVLIIFCISCSTVKYKEVPVPIETTKIEYINKVYRDSIYVRDSTDRHTGEDGVVYQDRYKYIYKYLTRVDTIIKTDSIEVPVEIKTVEIKEVNKLKWYQSLFMTIGKISLLILIIYFGIKLKDKIKLIKGIK